jgi:hypothetical protein
MQREEKKNKNNDVDIVNCTTTHIKKKIKSKYDISYPFLRSDLDVNTTNIIFDFLGDYFIEYKKRSPRGKLRILRIGSYCYWHNVKRWDEYHDPLNGYINDGHKYRKKMSNKSMIFKLNVFGKIHIPPKCYWRYSAPCNEIRWFISENNLDTALIRQLETLECGIKKSIDDNRIKFESKLDRINVFNRCYQCRSKKLYPYPEQYPVIYCLNDNTSDMFEFP